MKLLVTTPDGPSSSAAAKHNPTFGNNLCVENESRCNRKVVSPYCMLVEGRSKTSAAIGLFRREDGAIRRLCTGYKCSRSIDELGAKKSVDRRGPLWINARIIDQYA